MRALRLAALLALLPVALLAADFAAERAQVLALGELTAPPAWQPAEGVAGEGGIKAIYFDALPWRGKPTRVYAWLGLPDKRDGKVPGIVLLHGGGGTAFKEWVRKWNEHGFAAIAIAVEGQTDEHDVANPKAWKRHAWAGPPRNGIYADSGEPLAEQWMYHAIADTVLAHALLRSLPEVDGDKIGAMGISWGGVITSTVIGIDTRLAFAIPTYGCGHLFDAENQYGQALARNKLYREVWDPMVRMNRVQVPVLWFSWPQDEHFPLDDQAACYRAAPGPHLVSLVPGMHHGHGAGWTPPDSYGFAESIVREGRPWCRQVGAESTDGVAQVEFNSTRTLDRALLVSTSGTGFMGNRTWIGSPATIEKRGDAWRVTAPLPPGTTAWFINAHGGDLTASSDYQETKAQAPRP